MVKLLDPHILHDYAEEFVDSFLFCNFFLLSRLDVDDEAGDHPFSGDGSGAFSFFSAMIVIAT